jgi:hypothetical protein
VAKAGGLGKAKTNQRCGGLPLPALLARAGRHLVFVVVDRLPCPDIYLAWGKVKLTLWTHKINGLTESDFVLAAKADRLLPL